MSPTTGATPPRSSAPRTDRPQIRKTSLITWVERSRRRLGFQAALAAASAVGLWLFPLLALARWLLHKAASGLGEAPGLLMVSLTALGGAATLAYMRRPSRLASAIELDRALGAEGAVASAFELEAQETSGYVALVREAADRRLAGVRLAQALPLRWPSTVGPSLLLLTAFLAALLIRPQSHRPAPVPPATTPLKAARASVALSPAELALLAERAERLLSTATSDAGRERAREFRELVEQLKAGKLDQRQALSLAAALERDIRAEVAKGVPLGDDPEAPLAGDRQQESPAPPEDDLAADRAEALERLAERLADAATPPTARELEKIRETLAKTREEARRREQAERAANAGAEQRLREKERRLLDKKDQGGLSQPEADELERTKRELERLERRKQATEQAASELDRQLAEAMRELSSDPRRASEFLDQAADGQSREANRQLTDDEKRELLEQLRALKERLRQEEQSDLAEQLRQFERRARGGNQPGGEQGSGKPGGGAVMPRAAGTAGDRANGPGSPGDGSMQAGTSTAPEAGTEHDPNWQGEATAALGSKTEDKAAAARDTGEGAAESETILTAAEAGFRAAAYERLYKDYETVLEEMVKGEAIPRGRRTEVERYFDLIRPRDE